MQFISIVQYFHRFYSILLLMVLIPTFAFIVIYVRLPEVTVETESTFVLASAAGAAVVFWLAGFLFFTKKIKSIRNRQGLGLKLEKYFYITIVRYIVIVIGCLILAVGFHLTNDDVLTGLFLIDLLSLGLLWPTASKVSADLKLRGDEREMVYYKKDKL